MQGEIDLILDLKPSDEKNVLMLDPKEWHQAVWKMG